MKKKVLATVVVALAGVFATPVFAQQGAKAECPKQQCEATKCQAGKCDQAKSPFANLGLTAEQQKKIDALRADCQKNAKECKEQAKTDRKDRREAMGKRRAEYLAKIKDILTPEQYVKFLENAFVEAQPTMQRMKGDFKGAKKIDRKEARKADRKDKK